MMKYAINFLALLVPLAANAGSVESRVGVYTDCVRWTTVNGVEHSKKFEYALKEDQSMYLDILFYTGTAKCEGEGEVLMHVENFDVSNTVGEFPKLFMLEARDKDAGDYYEFMYSSDSVIINSNDKLPVEYDMNRTLLLNKVK